MKKVLVLGAILLFLFTLFAGCNNRNGEINPPRGPNVNVDDPVTVDDDIPSQSPQLYVSLITGDLSAQDFRAAQGTVSWIYYEASGEHPLDFWKETLDGIDFSLFIGQLEDSNGGEIQLQFSHFPPNTVVVQRWSSEFIGMSDQMWNRYDPVEINDNIIRVTDTGNDYIYQVIAIWEQDDNMPVSAKAFYTFRINSGR